MNDKTAPKADADSRKERLAAQLRANLARRKAQARAKRAGAADERPEGLAPSPERTTPREPKPDYDS
ncbi:hypothetical protein [Oricola cellulosilytica]|uniref:Uncharacterized protein n=1 Tax=Oricola cellulosilytica TaxID=1429082 RepID=A0A4V2MNY9_9HYPH|nr:hypothetical protein [Oricola cellulosilytica]TCD15257.1 hypothetical protein E0D97_06890 [Oricola cellulosilytica]